MVNHVLVENLKEAWEAWEAQKSSGCKLNWHFSSGNTFLTNAEHSLDFPGRVGVYIWLSYSFDFDGERVRFEDFTFEELLVKIPELRYLVVPQVSRFDRINRWEFSDQN